MIVSTEVRGVIVNPVPVPDIVIVCGLPDALSAIKIEELRVPVVVGVKVTVIVQLALTARVAPQLLVCEKSAELPPETAIELTLSCAVPTLVTVTGCGLLATPVCTLPKFKLELLRLTSGVFAADRERNATICMIHCPELSGAVAL